MSRKLLTSSLSVLITERCRGSQIQVGEKTNEIPVALTILAALPVEGRVFTSDAMHTHLPDLPSCPAPGWLYGPQSRTTNPPYVIIWPPILQIQTPLLSKTRLSIGSSGDWRVRRILVTTALNDYLQQDWPGVLQVAQLTSIVTENPDGEDQYRGGLVFLRHSLSSRPHLCVCSN
jgi:hypothetical protein